MAYLKDLEALIGALQHGVIDDPQTGWAQLEGLKADQRAKRQERKASLAEMLSGVQMTGYETAMDGGNLNTLLANPAIAQAQAKFGTDALMQMLSPYFNTTQPDIPMAPDPTYGQSLLNPTAPTLSSTDAADVTRIVADELAKGTTVDPTALFNLVMEGQPPEVGPQVSKLINDTLNQLKKRY